MHPRLEAMKLRASRHLDGMVVNRDAMASDVLILVDALDTALRKLETARPAAPAVGAAEPGKFGDLFSTLFRGGA